VQKLTFDNT